MSTLEMKTRRYLDSIGIVLSSLNDTKISDLTNDALFVLDKVNRYVKDARYYLEKGNSSIALASVSYAEGLLDALKFLNILDFQWPDLG